LKAERELEREKEREAKLEQRAEMEKRRRESKSTIGERLKSIRGTMMGRSTLSANDKHKRDVSMSGSSRVDSKTGDASSTVLEGDGTRSGDGDDIPVSRDSNITVENPIMGSLRNTFIEMSSTNTPRVSERAPESGERDERVSSIASSTID
jgi:hypothetical protein